MRRSGPSGHDDDYEHLVDYIKQEFEAVNAIRDVDLTDELIDDLAEYIATNIHYAFEYRPRDDGRHPSRGVQASAG